MALFAPRPDFQSLSVKDLLDARDHYHVHLSHQENVVGTAIGFYRIRARDPDAKNPDAPHVKGREEPRTLGNTVVRTWSWPCVLVFVDEWRPLAALRRTPEDVVPSRLYLPDGRVVPTCVIYAPRGDRPSGSLTRLTFPRGAIGGGYPVLTDVQGQEHVGSLGCLVSDGDVVYALTNRHVVGEPGRKVYSVLHGQRVEIGESDRRQVGKQPFAEVYPGFPGAGSYCNLDAGLIRVHDLRAWTAQVFGVGELGPIINLSSDNITLDLIGCNVRAFGAATGALTGQIVGLFYRYRTLAGVDFVADFLIGPREGRAAPATRPGDSGTVWCWDPGPGEVAPAAGAPARAPTRRPLAIQWGGEVLLDATGRTSTHFALATSLSQVCRYLDVSVVRDWGTGLSEYWGKVGHYKIAAKACELVTSKKLRTLLMANRDRIGVVDDDLVAGKLPMNNQPEFVALADVADLVWRTTRKKDQANHFADMDQAGQGAYADHTLLDLWKTDPVNRTPQAWTAFYDALEQAEGKRIQDKYRGALPFRVADIYARLVGFLKAGDVERFVCAAGIVAHYVGDACQPLHVSYLHHGRPGHEEESDVHSIYETKMLDQRAAEMVEGVNALLAKAGASPPALHGPAEAAGAVVDLMTRTLNLIPPIEVIEAYNAEEGKARIPHMWDTLGPRTVRTIANGSQALARLWQSAWKEGKGDRIAAAKLAAVDTKALRTLYMDRSFLEAQWLREMAWPLLP